MVLGNPLPPLHSRAPSSIRFPAMTLAEDDDSASPSSVAFKALLLGVAIGYGTNFPVGRMMNGALPASATTSGRFALAAVGLAPFVPRLHRDLVLPALLTGLCDAIGYCAQSVALTDSPAAKVSLLGALTVVVVPCLEAAFDGRRLGFWSAPQTWMAAVLTMAGVGCLELGGSTEALQGAPATSDAWAVLQALGFGSSFYLIGRMLNGEPDSDDPSSSAEQVLPLTAVNIATVALFSAVWAVVDGCGVWPLAESPTAGWLLDETSRASYAMPGVLLGPLGAAVCWCGFVTTALVRVGESTGLQRVRQSDAAVIIATEPLWAAVFGLVLLGEDLGPSSVLGGALVVAACMISSAKPEAVRSLLPSWLPSPSRELRRTERGVKDAESHGDSD